MTRILALCAILFSLTIAACSKDKDRTEDLPASIQTYIDQSKSCTCEPYIDLYRWQNQDVYLLAHKGPACNTFPGYFNSKGEEIQMEEGYTLDEFMADGERIKNIWTCSPTM